MCITKLATSNNTEITKIVCIQMKMSVHHYNWDREKIFHHFPDDIFKCIFSNENEWILITISLVCSKGSNEQYSIIGSENGLAPIRWQAIIWATHYTDVIMTTMASQITSLTVVYSTVYLDADQRKHQSSASLAFVWGIHRDRWIPHTKGQLRGKCFHLMTSSWMALFDDAYMRYSAQ